MQIKLYVLCSVFAEFRLIYSVSTAAGKVESGARVGGSRTSAKSFSNFISSNSLSV
jgi:hypothetical protein